jgi:hypothetical protein
VRGLSSRCQLVNVDPLHPGYLHDLPFGGQYDLGFAILDHECLAFYGSVLVKRYMSRATFEDGQFSDHEFNGAFKPDCHKRIGFDAEPAQVMCQAVGLGVQFGIGQLRVLVHDRDRVRRSGRLCLEQSGRITNQIVIELRQANL